MADLKLEQPIVNDTNLLRLMFILARNDNLLQTFLLEIQFIRDRPQLTEEEIRREIRHIEHMRRMPYKPTGTA